MSLVRSRSAIFKSPEEPVGSGDYLPRARSSLLTNHGMISFRVQRDVADTVVLTEGRNCMLVMFQIFAPNLQQLRIDFHAILEFHRVRIDSSRFIALLSHYVQHRNASKTPPFADQELFRAAEKRLSSFKTDYCMQTEHFTENESFDALIAKPGELEKHIARLFRAVDYDGSGSISWESFFSFMTESVVAGPVSKKEETRQFVMNKSTCAYFPDGHVETVRRVLAYDLVHIIRPHPFLKDVNDAQIRVYDESAMCMGAPNVQFDIPFHPFHLMDYTYLKHVGAVLMSSSDFKFRLCRVSLSSGSMASSFQEFSVGNVFCRVEYSTYWTKLFSASTEGDLVLWNLNETSLRKYEVNKVAAYKMHRSRIAEVLFLPVDGTVVTGSMDPQLLIQEGETGRLVASLKGHANGIRSVDYWKPAHSLLSAGFDSEVFFWPLLSAGAAKPMLLTDKIDPHNHCIVSVKALEDVPQAISLDTFGLLKVWDLRMMLCLQSFHLPRKARMIRDRDFHSMDVSRLVSTGNITCYCAKNAYTVGTASKMSGDPTETIIFMTMSSSTGSVVTSTQSSFQTWEVRSGVLSSKYPTTGGELSCCVLELEGRKIICCHLTGRVSVFSTASGRLLTTFVIDDSSAVLDIVACTNNRCVACLTSGEVVGFSDTDGQRVTMEKTWRNQPPQVIVTSPQAALVFHLDGGITVYSLLTQMPSFSSSLLPDLPDPACAVFCRNTIVVAATCGGDLAVFRVVVEDRRNPHVSLITKVTLGPLSAPMSTAVTPCMAVIEEMQLVVVADRGGALCILSVADPTQPMLLQRHPFGGVGAPSVLLPIVSAGLLYVSTGQRCVTILSLGDLSQRPLGSFSLDGMSFSLPQDVQLRQLELVQCLRTAEGTPLSANGSSVSGAGDAKDVDTIETMVKPVASALGSILKPGFSKHRRDLHKASLRGHASDEALVLACPDKNPDRQQHHTFSSSFTPSILPQQSKLSDVDSSQQRKPQALPSQQEVAQQFLLRSRAGTASPEALLACLRSEINAQSSASKVLSSIAGLGEDPGRDPTLSAAGRSHSPLRILCSPVISDGCGSSGDGDVEGDEDKACPRMSASDVLLLQRTERQRDHLRPTHHALIDRHRKVLAENDLQRNQQVRLMTALPVSNGVTTRALTPHGWSKPLVASTDSAKAVLPLLPANLGAKHGRKH